jgi:hypothetical protein
MSATVRQAGIRLSLQGAQEVTRGLREVGDQGERNLQRVTQEAGAAAAALRLLGPILGGLGAGLGLGSLVGMAQTYVTSLATEMLGLRDNTDEVRRAAESMMTALRDESRSVRDVIREIGDLFLTAAQRAANLANAQRENLRLSTELRLSNAIQMQDAAAGELPRVERELARAQEALRLEQQLQDRARRAGGATPQDGSSDAQRRIFSLTAQVEGLRAEAALQSQRIGELNEARDRILRGGSVGTEQFGPNLPPRTAGGGGRSRAAPRDTSKQDAERLRAAQLRAAQQLNAFDQAANLQAAGLERAGPVLQAYEQRLAALDQALRLGVLSQEQYAEGTRAAAEALDGQIENATRAADATNNLSRELSRFSASAASDFVKAAVAGKNLGDTISNIASRLGGLFLDRAFQSIFGGGKGGGFDLFGSIFGAIGGAFSGGATVGARANGGPVEAGRPYIVGERRPELFVPRSAGTVMPSAATAAPTIVQNFDFRGALMAEPAFRRIAREESQRAVGGLVEGRRESKQVLA